MQLARRLVACWVDSLEAGPCPLQEYHRLQTRDLKSLPAARILALDKIIPAQQIGPGFLVARPVSLVRLPPECPLLRALQPSDLVRGGLPAEQAGEIGRFQDFFLVKKISLFHAVGILS